jgi:3-phenylpropionate/cinnamic acid dioxygenase small subunit
MELHYDCVQFYNRESDLLDEKRLEEWLELLTEDVRYDMPIRISREKGAERSEFSVDGFNYREDRSTLEARVERFQSEFAWSEDPPSRTRHHVSNVQVVDVNGNEIETKTNLLLFRAQGEDSDGTVLSAEREDTLRRTDDGLKLAGRDIYLDHTVLPWKNISVFF